ncbi:hypothetical protein H2200_006292 [Cladophialophora chaetospira]|uniref:C2H2-type domain-containing protein n=1 Tax=Cladophialophora chaetospira TaxID=386627 RepID=A0AA38XAM6_9EURO|nr:hypothetical protein H2200_006292 [Cladophialophora chaetospira]
MSSDLTDAIDAATASRLRMVLHQLCEDSSEAKNLVTKALLLPSAESNLSALGDTTSRKRKRYEVCKNCNKEYEVERNNHGNCVYHPGEKIVDYESSMWDDHDDKTHGAPEMHEDDPDFQDGFNWSCCEGEIASKGCETTKHEPKVSGSRSKKRGS